MCGVHRYTRMKSHYDGKLNLTEEHMCHRMILSFDTDWEANIIDRFHYQLFWQEEVAHHCLPLLEVRNLKRNNCMFPLTNVYILKPKTVDHLMN